MDLQSIFPIYLPKSRTDDQSKEDYETQITQNENVLNQNLSILFNGLRDLASEVDLMGSASTETVIQTVVKPSEGGGSEGGTSDHAQLFNRDLVEQHPMSAITGLVAELGNKLGTNDALTNAEIEALIGGN